MKKLLMFIPVAALVLASCGGGGKTEEVKEISGAGATFPYPLYSKMFSEYNTKTGIKVNYQSIGSGGGVKQIFEKTVDFGASDAFLSDKEMTDAKADMINVPTCIGGDVLTYNLPGNPKLKLTPEIIGGIFAGSIKKWNDPRIMAENAGANLGDKDIMVVHRSDGSGTTFLFTDYLTRVSPEFAAKVPKAGKTVDWPVGVGGKGNEGVAGQIKSTEGAFGYVELIYAQQNNMPVADVKNSSGKYITPTLATISASGNGDIPADTRIAICNSSNPEAYPIASFTWLLIYKEQKYGDRTMEKAKAVVDMMWWMTHDAQQYNEALLYGKLPTKALTAAEALLKSVTYDGKPLLTDASK